MLDGYLGNPLLKPTNVQINFTKEQVEELVRCVEDPIYFIRNYIKIIQLDRGAIPLDLYEFQETAIKTIIENRFVIAKWPRQSGKSTIFLAYLLHYILFNKNVSVVILANKADTAQELLSRLQFAYENLPSWMQQGIVTWNKRNIILENGSKIKAAATSSASVRGGSYNCIVLDEFAHIDNNLAEQFFRSVYPTISSGKSSKVVIVSTPKGMNHYYQMWSSAEKAAELRAKGKINEANVLSQFVPISVNWWDVPGRDEKWKEQEIANIGDEAFEQEYNTDFIGSSDTLISPKQLRRLASQWTKPLYSQNGLDVYEEPIIELNKDEDGDLVQKPHKYVIAADTAWGKGLDYSAFIVVDVTDQPYTIVAKFRSNIIAPLLYPNKVYEVARKYNNAYVLVEINDVGMQVAQALHFDLEYENLLTCQPKGRSGQQISTGFSKNVQLGVKMTKPVKQTGCANVKTLLEHNKLLCYDLDIISELTTFVHKGDKNTYAADEGSHDDLVMAMVVFCWAVSQKYFKELMDQDIRLGLQRDMEDQIESDLLPSILINDGRNSDQYENIEGDPKGDAWIAIDYLNGWSNF